LKYVRKTTVYVLKIEAVCSSEMLVSTYKSTRRRNPEDQYRLLFQIWIFGNKCKYFDFMWTRMHDSALFIVYFIMTLNVTELHYEH
jgi:hypothetical protein